MATGCGLSGALTALAADAAERVADDIAVWSWLYDRLGFDPCHPALWRAGLFLGAVRGCDMNAETGFWQVTGLPRSLARHADRAVLTLPVVLAGEDGGAAVEVFALDPIEPRYHRQASGLVPVLPLDLGGPYFPVPDRLRLHATLLDWLKGVAGDLIDGHEKGGPRDAYETGRAWVGDWRANAAMPLRAAIGLGRTEAVCDSDRHALAIRDMLRPPRPKLKLGVAAAAPARRTEKQREAA